MLNLKHLLEEILETQLEFSEVADFTSTIAFKLSKEQKKDPKEIAEEITEKIKKILESKNFDYVEVKAVNGYINFYLTDKFYIKNFKNILNFQPQKKHKKIILEHTSVNPTGPIHIGRIRNALIGDSIARILKFCNYDVEVHYYVNDMGKQIAIIALAKKKNLKKILEKYENASFSKLPNGQIRNDYETLFYYLAGNELMENDENFGKEVMEIIKKAESNDIEALNLMKETAKFCLEGQKYVFKLLNINFDFYDFESDFIANGDVQKVINFLGREINLDEIKRGIVLAREDGTSVYLARDIAYHLYKINLGDILINVLGEDHKQEATELKIILEKKFNIKKEIKILFFSFVNFQGQRFSTRKGNIITIDELIQDAIENAKKIMISKNFALEGYEKIGIGAIKYYILNVDPRKPITFNLNDALNFDGNTSCYIQYAYARCSRIIEKSNISEEEIKNFEISIKNLNENEKNLMRNLVKFFYIIEESARQLKPNILSNYLYDISNLFSKFYESCPILNEEKEIKERRLLIVFITKFVLKNGLNLLGIETVEKM